MKYFYNVVNKLLFLILKKKIIHINKIMRRNYYRNINQVGSNELSQANNPLTYCIFDDPNKSFEHGSTNIYRINSAAKSCQEFMAEHCAKNWDGFCELATQTNSGYINLVNNVNNTTPYANIIGNHYDLKNGDVLLANTARKKYLTEMKNCVLKTESFDPTVAASPMIHSWVPADDSISDVCLATYEVDPEKIDDDIVMNKILAKPYIAMDILTNIYNNAKRKGTLEPLLNTNLGKFFLNNPTYFN
jgi:hypothetical protein